MILVPLKDDLEAELLESPEEREPVSSSKNRRDFGTCQVQEIFSSKSSSSNCQAQLEFQLRLAELAIYMQLTADPK